MRKTDAHSLTHTPSPSKVMSCDPCMTCAPSMQDADGDRTCTSPTADFEFSGNGLFVVQLETLNEEEENEELHLPEDHMDLCWDCAESRWERFGKEHEYTVFCLACSRVLPFQELDKLREHTCKTSEDG
jgi:hypothetical protein